MKKLLVVLLVLNTSLISKAPSLPEQVRGVNLSLLLCKQREKIIDEKIESITTSEFSIELLKEYLELVYPNSSNVVIKQFVLETGWFKSKIFRENNNICGMKLPYKRYTKATGKKYKHAAYNHWTDSVDDYFLLIKYHTDKGMDTSDYYEFLLNINYASNTSYTDILRCINV